jgi:hypothetical protein
MCPSIARLFLVGVAPLSSSSASAVSTAWARSCSGCASANPKPRSTSTAADRNCKHVDERLDRTVRLRERWLEFLLGAAPKIDEFGLDDEPAQPLPPALADVLRIDLGPARTGT